MTRPSRLSRRQIEAIRKAPGPLKVIAADFGISIQLVSDIRTGKVHKES